MFLPVLAGYKKLSFTFLSGPMMCNARDGTAPPDGSFSSGSTIFSCLMISLFGSASIGYVTFFPFCKAIIPSSVVQTGVKSPACKCKRQSNKQQATMLLQCPSIKSNQGPFAAGSEGIQTLNLLGGYGWEKLEFCLHCRRLISHQINPFFGWRVQECKKSY
uniref:Uncharacterized protein n=1 Tax=Cucumis melo TaxID=3656 RepID=A0A9I9EC63_CUCME